MNILIAPNSMKGSLNAFDFADTVEKAFLNVSATFKIRKVPVADGGDFTREVLKRAINATDVFVNVKGPLGAEVEAKYSVSGKTAIIEMADASGMKLIGRNELNPLKASSYGTGQLIADAIKNGRTEILLAIGGSATVDGGTGMMEALGFRFLDSKNNLLHGNGANLKYIRSIKKPEQMNDISIKIICDVDNPLTGKNGAAAVFGPQKGATSEMVAELDAGLKNMAGVIAADTGKHLRNIAGVGAAGGLAVPLIAYFNAKIVKGADFILDKLDFDKHLKWADIVITGEGKLDRQTLGNKAPFVVAKMAQRYNKPVYAFAGEVEKTNFPPFTKVFGIVNSNVKSDEAIKNVAIFLYNMSVNFAKTVL